MKIIMIEEKEYEYDDVNNELAAISRDHINGLMNVSKCMDELVEVYMVDTSSMVIVDTLTNQHDLKTMINGDTIVLNMKNWPYYDKILISKTGNKYIWATH